MSTSLLSMHRPEAEDWRAMHVAVLYVLLISFSTTYYLLFTTYYLLLTII
ncbi:MAG: hypothetical protein K9I29_09515 [Bacteroidales bacterium]|nr:hypothetical protein [Bacteroidales bacterium]MCF8328516.1 hypothetical protein [Bacteroidales bacterium]